MEQGYTFVHTTPLQSSAHNISLYKGCVPARYNEADYLPWDNVDNIVSEQVEEDMNKVTDLALVFLSLIGLPANVINMSVFYKQGLHDRVNLCLFSLSLCDGLYLIAALLLHGENIYLTLTGQRIETPMNKFVVNNYIIVLYTSGFVSVFLTAIIACERCYCVMRPLKYQNLIRTRTTGLLILAVAVTITTVNFIVANKYWIGCIYDPVTGEKWMKMIGGNFYYAHQEVIDYLDSILLGVGVPGAMMVVVITATIITTVKLYQIVAWRAEAASALSPREVALTKMLIGSSILFIICVSPGSAFRVACLFMPEMGAGGRHRNLFFTTLWLLESTYFINASFNIFIYYIMGSRYRETFWTLFRKNPAQKVNK